ncbi:MAG: carboxymuconolactone decarboxylase family protein [Betaproteobacteria bacterium]|jgi:alkylhydroperoxidase family enzyme
MARIPLVPLDLKEPKEIVDAVRNRRGGELSELDRLLLHSPALTEGYNFFLGKVRNNLTTIPKLRELAMCTVAVVNKADYEYNAHLPLFVAAGGTPEKGKAILELESAIKNTTLFDATEIAVLRLTLEMTRDVQVTQETFDLARKAMGGDQQLVDLVGTIATYNLVSRFLVAFELH